MPAYASSFRPAGLISVLASVGLDELQGLTLTLLGGVALGLLVLGVLVALAWGRALRAQVSARTRELSRSLEAYEQTQQELKRSEERFARAFRSSPVAMSISTVEEGRYLFVNDAFVALVGLDEDEIVGKTALELGFWPSAERRAEATQRIAQGGNLRDYELALRRGSGEYRDILLSLEKVELAGQACLLGTAHDITERKRSERELIESRSFLERAQRVAALGSWALDLRGGRLPLWSRKLLEILGDPGGGAPPTLEEFNALIHPDDRSLVDEAARRAIEGSVDYDVEFRIARPDLTLRWIRSRAEVIRDAAGQPLRMIGVAQDVTDRRRAADLLLGERTVLEAMALGRPLAEVLELIVRTLESQSLGMLGSVLLLDPADRRLRYGAAPGLPEAFRAASDGLAIGPRAGSCGTAAFRRQLVVTADIAQDPLWEDARDLALAHGLRACWSSPIFSSTGEVLGTFAMYYPEPRWPAPEELQLMERAVHLAQIAIERDRAQRQVQHMVFHDALTGLGNRQLLLEQLRVALARARRDSSRVAVFFMDLDRFKDINDSLGHSAGDQLLRALGRRIQGVVREEDTLARLGGDEFVLLVPSLEGTEDAGSVAEKLLAALRPPFEIAGHELYVTGSIGVALFPEDGEDGESLIKGADAAMYRAKERGRDQFQLYAPTIGAEASARLDLENSLRRGVSLGQFVFHYQPFFELASGRLKGAEALLRWNHPARGLLYPGDFITTAELTGAITLIGDWAFGEVCRRALAWDRAGHPGLTVAINLSARQFRGADFVGTVRRALEETGLAPGRLVLEITESVAMENAPATAEALRQLKALGVRIAIDDFGTGYSSLGYLKRFPIDALKIDRSFVHDIPEDASAAAIAATIIAMSHTLGFEVVAEGVEREQQRDFLRGQGCDQAQGWLFARALTPEAFEAFLAGLPEGALRL